MGIISLTTSTRHPGSIMIVTNSAPGFLSLAKSDKDLQDLYVSIMIKDKKLQRRGGQSLSGYGTGNL